MRQWVDEFRTGSGSDRVRCGRNSRLLALNQAALVTGPVATAPGSEFVDPRRSSFLQVVFEPVLSRISRHVFAHFSLNLFLGIGDGRVDEPV